MHCAGHRRGRGPALVCPGVPGASLTTWFKDICLRSLRAHAFCSATTPYPSRLAGHSNSAATRTHRGGDGGRAGQRHVCGHGGHQPPPALRALRAHALSVARAPCPRQAPPCNPMRVPATRTRPLHLRTDLHSYLPILAPAPGPLPWSPWPLAQGPPPPPYAASLPPAGSCSG